MRLKLVGEWRSLLLFPAETMQLEFTDIQNNDMWSALQHMISNRYPICISKLYQNTHLGLLHCLIIQLELYIKYIE